MYEIEKSNDIPSTKSLSKLGVSAVGCVAAGIFLLVLKLPLVGIIAGVFAVLFGIGNIMSKDPSDKRAGILISAAGALTILSVTNIPHIAPVSGVLLTVGAVGLLALGVINAVKFFRGLKKRS